MCLSKKKETRVQNVWSAQFAILQVQKHSFGRGGSAASP